MKRLLVVAGIVLLLAPQALADRIYLRSRPKPIEGKLLSQDSEKVQVEVKIGSMTSVQTFSRSEIDHIEKSASPEDAFNEAFQAAKTADEFVKLAAKAKEDGLSSQAERAWKKAIDLDKDCKEAHEALGHHFEGGRWYTDKEWKERPDFADKKKQEAEERAKKEAAKNQEKYGRELEGVDWADAHIIETKHYIVKCNSTKEVAQRYSDFLEKIYAAYDKVFAGYKHYYNKKSTVYIFRNNKEFQEISRAGEGVGGYYRPKSPDENMYPNRVVAAFHGRFGTSGDTRLVLAHEGTHQMEHILCMGTEEQFLARPPWWAEGFAVYFGDGYSLDKKGALSIGIPRDRLSSLQQLLKGGHIPGDGSLKISEFVKWDYGPYQGMAGIAYPYGWGLVYYFMHRGEDKKGAQKPVKINGKDVMLAKVLEDFFKVVTDVPPSNLGEEGLPEYYAKKLDTLLGFPVDGITEDWKKFILALELPKLGKVKGQIFESPEAAFTIEKPKDWKWDEEGCEGDEAIRIENEKTSGLVKVSVEGNMENKTLEELTSETEDRIAQVIEGIDWEISARDKDIDVGGYAAKEIVYKGTVPDAMQAMRPEKRRRQGEQWVRHVIIFTLKRTYHVVCVSNADKADENKPAFDATLKAFKIMKEKEG